MINVSMHRYTDGSASVEISGLTRADYDQFGPGKIEAFKDHKVTGLEQWTKTFSLVDGNSHTFIALWTNEPPSAVAQEAATDLTES